MSPGPQVFIGLYPAFKRTYAIAYPVNVFILLQQGVICSFGGRKSDGDTITSIRHARHVGQTPYTILLLSYSPVSRSLCAFIFRKRSRDARHLAAMYDTASTVVYVYFAPRILCTSLSCTTREPGTRQRRTLVSELAMFVRATWRTPDKASE